MGCCWSNWKPFPTRGLHSRSATTSLRSFRSLTTRSGRFASTRRQPTKSLRPAERCLQRLANTGYRHDAQTIQWLAGHVLFWDHGDLEALFLRLPKTFFPIGNRSDLARQTDLSKGDERVGDDLVSQTRGQC